MTMWVPRLVDDGRPRYEAIADAIARDVRRGTLSSGDRLPTHRRLAELLGVTVGTVSRAYAEASRRGLTVGEVGRGTFVQSTGAADELFALSESERSDSGEQVDLGLALPWSPPDGENARRLADTLESISRDGCHEDLLRYQPESASWRHREAAAHWLGTLGAPDRPDRVALTAGSQHGLLVTLSAALGPGDALLTGDLTYPGIKSVARTLGLRLHGVALDEEGIVPEALDRVARDTSARALYCVPTFQNPTCATMSEERRVAVAEVAWERDLLVVEDDLYAPVAGGEVASLVSLAPERTVFLASFSKAVAFGLRVGAIHSPPSLLERLRGAIRASLWMPPPLMVEVAMRWIADGTYEELIQRNLEELAIRHELLVDALGSRVVLRSEPRALHAWLQLPEPWRSADFVRTAAQQGVHVAGAEAFAVGRGPVPHAVRIGLGSEPHRDRIATAFTRLAEVLDGPAQCCGEIL